MKKQKPPPHITLPFPSLFVVDRLRCAPIGCSFAVLRCQDDQTKGKSLNSIESERKWGTSGELQGTTARRLALKTVTSLNKEVRPFFLSDNSIWSFPSVSSLSDYSIRRA